MQNKKNLSFLITFLGCKVNSYEVECVANELEKNGYHNFDKSIDDYPEVIIINTCAVTKNSESKSNRSIKKFKKDYPNSIIVVMGCFSKLNKEICVESGADIVLGTQNRSNIYQLINNYKTTNNKYIDYNEVQRSKEIYESISLSHYLYNTRAFVKIQDGCDNFCTYCIIPFLRGKSRSRKKEEVLNEIKTLVNNNYKEIVLTGIDTASYGLDLYSNYNFSDLLEDILKENPNLYRLRISSIEESQIDDKFISLLKKYPNIADHLHVPLQSGCEKILESMHRKYDLKAFEEKIEKIRNVRPDISFTTDVIVGFPGEDDKDFLETYNFINKIKFSKVHVFPYSIRKGTLAAKFENQIDSKIKKERVEKLIELSNKLSNEYNNKFKGKEIEFLFENEKKNKYIGHSSNFLEISLESKEELNGKIKKVIF